MGGLDHDGCMGKIYLEPKWPTLVLVGGKRPCFGGVDRLTFENRGRSLGSRYLYIYNFYNFWSRKKSTKCRVSFHPTIVVDSWTSEMWKALKFFGTCRCVPPEDEHGCFRKWWYPTTMGFPTKNDHFGVFWGYPYFWKHPHRTYKWWFGRLTTNFFFEGFLVRFHVNLLGCTVNSYITWILLARNVVRFFCLGDCCLPEEGGVRGNLFANVFFLRGGEVGLYFLVDG